MPKTVLVLLSLGILLISAGCPSGSGLTERQRRIETKITEMTKALEKVQERVKAAGRDFGLRDQLLEEQELLRSRLERLKITLQKETAAIKAGLVHGATGN